MVYKDLDSYTAAAFHRYTGVTRDTFTTILRVLRQADQKDRRNSGLKPQLCVEDRLLLALEYSHSANLSYTLQRHD